MFLLSIGAISRSPFARMIAVFAVESMIARGWLRPETASQATEDAIHIIGFIGMVATLLIWQWRIHHPAKTEIEKTTGETTFSVTTDVPVAKRYAIMDKIIGLFVTPKQ